MSDENLLKNIEPMGDTPEKRFERMQAEVRRMDAMLGRRPCQNERCDKLNAALALLAEVAGVKVGADFRALEERIRDFLK